MKTVLFLVAVLGFVASRTAVALTTEQHITPDYVRSHATEFSVVVTKEKNGLLAFTVTCTFAEPRYVVADLAVRSGDRLLAESHTPAFTKNSKNTFYFSIMPECLATSAFTLGVSTFVDSGSEAVPVPGTIDYRLRLPDFVSPELIKSPDNK